MVSSELITLLRKGSLVSLTNFSNNNSFDVFDLSKNQQASTSLYDSMNRAVPSLKEHYQAVLENGDDHRVRCVTDWTHDRQDLFIHIIVSGDDGDGIRHFQICLCVSLYIGVARWYVDLGYDQQQRVDQATLQLSFTLQDYSYDACECKGWR